MTLTLLTSCQAGPRQGELLEISGILVSEKVDMGKQVWVDFFSSQSRKSPLSIAWTGGGGPYLPSQPLNAAAASQSASSWPEITAGPGSEAKRMGVA